MSSPEQVTQWMSKAIGYHQKGRVDQAEKLYRRVLRQQPEHPDALHFLGVVANQRGQSRKAVGLIRRALKAQPDYADAHNNLGRILSELGDHEDAIRACEAAIRIRDDFADAHHNLGACLRIAERAGDEMAAVEAFRRAVELEPESPRHHIQLAGACRAADLLEEACTHYQRALVLDPGLSVAYENLGMLLYVAGRVEEARSVYGRWLEAEPGNVKAEHLYSSCGGTSMPIRASDGYVVSYFDDFAESFDEKLTALGYRAPNHIADAVAQILPAGQRVDFLDAGCGTGLCGGLLRRHAKTLIGVDLSGGMIDQARKLDTYDELVVDELMSFMATHQDAYDVVVSADTLVYFGDLDGVIAASYAALRDGGWLVFTVESLAGDAEAFVLNPHGRYSHSHEYVVATLDHNGFDNARAETVTLRMENKEPVLGYVVVAQRPRG